MKIQDIDKWIALINPLAGNRSNQKKLEIFLNTLRESVQVEILDATKNFVQQLPDLSNRGYKNIMLCGGDGTLNKIVNQILENEISVSYRFLIIPIGTGNDYYSFLSHASMKNLSDLVNNEWKIKPLFVGSISNRDSSEFLRFVNILGTGFDSQITTKYEKARTFKLLKGKHGYILTMIASLFGKINSEMELEINGEIYKGEHLLVAVGLGQFFGGGIMVCPHANGYQFAITRVEKLSPIKIIRNYLRLFNGTFVKNREVYQYHTDEIKIKTSQPIQIDGELIDWRSANIKLERTPHKVYYTSDSLSSV